MLPITVSFSLTKLLEARAIELKEPTASFSNGTFHLSFPFHFNNTGFYDVSDINVTITAMHGEKKLATFSNVFPKVAPGTTLDTSYNASITLERIAQEDREILTNDAEINTEVSAFFRVAYILGFKASLNVTMPWGAPFYNLSVSEVQYNPQNQLLLAIVSFENHFKSQIGGTMLLELYNSQNESLGSKAELIVAAPGLQIVSFEITVADPPKVTKEGFFRIVFENVLISEGVWEIVG